MKTILLLIASNVFMTLAWYGHLRSGSGEGSPSPRPLLAIILVSWLIALPEYCLAVPANRLGHVSLGGPFTAPQLKVIQEAVSLLVFLAFSLIALKEAPSWRELVGMGLIFAGLLVALSGSR